MDKYEKKYDAFSLFEELQAGEELNNGSFNGQMPEDKGKAADQSESSDQSEVLLPSSSSGQSEALPWSSPSGQWEPLSRNKKSASVSFAESLYYEIEYDSSPIPGAGKFVLKSQKIELPVKDEIRDIFEQMRDIARENRSRIFNSSRFYDKKIQRENSKIFYEQGMFMKDFEDHYNKKVTYASYFPYYQMMGYDQLRTFFTWRTEVRGGYVEKISLSYAFLYIYELLNNIGADDPEDGLEKLMFFWKEFRLHDESIDKYMRKWLKDYHIYYELPHSFKEFIENNNLGKYYPEQLQSRGKFELFCTVSKYDICKSGFYTEDRALLCKDCFNYVIERLEQVFTENHMIFEAALFQPAKNMSVWTPFKDALFHPWMKQRDRRVVFSEKEIYICSNNSWFFNTRITTESGRQLIGYIMKQMEAVLRKLTKYKYKLTANIDTVGHAVIEELKTAGISLEKVVSGAVMEFYREATKTVVKVNYDNLEKIRREALMTQEKLIVPEEEMWRISGPADKEKLPEKNCATAVYENAELSAVELSESAVEQFAEMVTMDAPEAAGEEGPWKELCAALNGVELDALRVLLNGGNGIRQLADDHGIMLEVLIDGINEKAMDFVGDSLLDDELMIYDDYINDVKGMVK